MTNSSMTISPVLAKILRAGRKQFNTRVSESKHRYPSFNAENFSDFLVKGIDPLVQSVDKIAPDYTSRVVVTAFDIALNLVGRDLAGPLVHNLRMNTLWQDIFPSIASHVANNPHLILGTLSNALINIEAMSGTRPDQWLAIMQKFAQRAQTDQHLLNIGVLAAWCCGAAHFREAALKAATTLPEDLVTDLLCIDKKISLSVLLQNLDTNPWWLLQLQSADEQLIKKEVGAFSGFGGHFSAPPQVRVNADGIVVKSGDRYTILIADAYGAIFLPASEEEFNAASHSLNENQKNALPVLQGSRVTSGSKMIELNFPSNGIELAFNEHTLALTSPYSFMITLVPR